MLATNISVSFHKSSTSSHTFGSNCVGRDPSTIDATPISAAADAQHAEDAPRPVAVARAACRLRRSSPGSRYLSEKKIIHVSTKNTRDGFLVAFRCRGDNVINQWNGMESDIQDTRVRRNCFTDSTPLSSPGRDKCDNSVHQEELPLARSHPFSLNSLVVKAQHS